MPLGGVGQSGTGSYRGRASFDCFTHRRSMTTTPSTGPSPFAAMYPPYEEKLAQLLTVEHGGRLSMHA
jgi:beta-apo-4'-carotenal oxygenase